MLVLILRKIIILCSVAFVVVFTFATTDASCETEDGNRN
jgi:hypothetical protein